MTRLATLSLILAVAIAPLAMYQLIDGLNSDIVSIAKAWVICAAGGLGALALATLEVKLKPLVVASALTLLLILSTIYSTHVAIALKGAPLLSEGLAVIGSYYILFVVASATMANPKVWARVMTALGLSVLAMTFIGCTEEIGSPVLLHPWAQWLMGVDPHTPLRLEGGFPTSATLGNPNHLGTYAALVGPLFLGLTMFTRDMLLPFVTGPLYLCAAALIVMSESTGGLIGFAIGSAVIVGEAFWKTRR